MILSTRNRGTTGPSSAAYGYMAGTSQAAPYVAAAAATVKAVDPSLSVAQVRDILTTTTRPISASGMGTGILDTAAAVRKAQSTVAVPAPAPTTPPTPTPRPPRSRLFDL